MCLAHARIRVRGPNLGVLDRKDFRLRYGDDCSGQLRQPPEVVGPTSSGVSWSDARNVRVTYLSNKKQPQKVILRTSSSVSSILPLLGMSMFRPRSHAILKLMPL